MFDLCNKYDGTLTLWPIIDKLDKKKPKKSIRIHILEKILKAKKKENERLLAPKNP